VPLLDVPQMRRKTNFIGMKSSKDTEIKQTIEINMGIEESENENDNDTDPDQDPDVGTVERKATIKRNKNLLSNNSTLEDCVNFL